MQKAQNPTDTKDQTEKSPTALAAESPALAQDPVSRRQPPPPTSSPKASPKADPYSPSAPEEEQAPYEKGKDRQRSGRK